jgi:hypothetical protein
MFHEPRLPRRHPAEDAHAGTGARVAGGIRGRAQAGRSEESRGGRELRSEAEGRKDWHGRGLTSLKITWLRLEHVH